MDNTTLETENLDNQYNIETSTTNTQVEAIIESKNIIPKEDISYNLYFADKVKDRFTDLINRIKNESSLENELFNRLKVLEQESIKELNQLLQKLNKNIFIRFADYTDRFLSRYIVIMNGDQVVSFRPLFWCSVTIFLPITLLAVIAMVINTQISGWIDKNYIKTRNALILKHKDLKKLLIEQIKNNQYSIKDNPQNEELLNKYITDIEDNMLLQKILKEIYLLEDKISEEKQYITFNDDGIEEEIEEQRRSIDLKIENLIRHKNNLEDLNKDIEKLNSEIHNNNELIRILNFTHEDPKYISEEYMSRLSELFNIAIFQDAELKDKTERYNNLSLMVKELENKISEFNQNIRKRDKLYNDFQELLDKSITLKQAEEFIKIDTNRNNIKLEINKFISSSKNKNLIRSQSHNDILKSTRMTLNKSYSFNR